MKLKELRKSKNLTQKDMGTILNVAPTTYLGYEKEINEPTIETLKKLADYYHVTLDYLVDREFANDIGYLTEQQLNLLNLIKTLDNRQCTKAEAYIYGLIDAKEEFNKNIKSTNIGA